jgi:hypothetical protein
MLMQLFERTTFDGRLMFSNGVKEACSFFLVNKFSGKSVSRRKSSNDINQTVARSLASESD